MCKYLIVACLLALVLSVVIEAQPLAGKIQPISHFIRLSLADQNVKINRYDRS